MIKLELEDSDFQELLACVKFVEGHIQTETMKLNQAYNKAGRVRAKLETASRKDNQTITYDFIDSEVIEDVE